MNRSIRTLVAVLTAAVCLWPTSLTAAAQEAGPVGRTLTIAQVRGTYAEAGFLVDQSNTWDWTSPPVTSFQIRDRTSDRTLMVLVYADLAAAQSARVHAQTQDSRDSASTTPHLIPGYGTSVWNGNVALVQATGSEFEPDFRIAERLQQRSLRRSESGARSEQRRGR